MNSLEHLLTAQATEKDYEEITDILVEITKTTYEDYKFRFYPSQDEVEFPNGLVIQNYEPEQPELFKKLFMKVIDSRADMQVVNEYFIEAVQQERVFPIGENAVLVGKRPEEALNTGVSNINSGLDGEEIVVNVAFISKENEEAYNQMFEAPEEE